jgi:hypothetical protein
MLECRLLAGSGYSHHGNLSVMNSCYVVNSERLSQTRGITGGSVICQGASKVSAIYRRLSVGDLLGYL